MQTLTSECIECRNVVSPLNCILQGHTFFWTCPTCYTANRNDLPTFQYAMLKVLVPCQCAYDDDFVKCGDPITLDDAIEFEDLLNVLDELVEVIELEQKIG